MILTIGHSTRPWSSFLALLRAHRIRLVVDVRTIPRSRRNPQFSRDVLERELRKAKIAYVHLPELGGLRHPRRDSQNLGWRNESFRGYADYMQTADFDEGLRRLMKLGRTKRTAIMCAEAVPWRCHRSLISDALTARGVRVEHILSEKRTQPHAPTSFAKVEGTVVTYPAAQENLF